jgi:hypothetical protein
LRLLALLRSVDPRGAKSLKIRHVGHPTRLQ